MPSIKSKLGAEFLGTYVLVSVVALNRALQPTDPNLQVFGPTAIACALMIMVYALGPISGAHLNPAVTFSDWLSKREKTSITKMDDNDKVALQYVIAQCAGGAVAGLCSYFVFSGGAELQPARDSLSLGAALVEFFYTFMLCFVVLNVAVVPTMPNAKAEPNSFYGVAIGFVIIAGGYAGGPVSGGAFNPAVALGIQFMGLSTAVVWLPIYVAAQFAAAFMATTVLHLVRPETKMPEENLEWTISKWVHKFESMFDPEDTSEFLGAFFLSLTVTLNAVVGDTYADVYDHSKGTLQNPGGVWSIAASLMCMIFALGDVSGGLFNPALTVAFLGRWFKTKEGFGKEKLCDPAESPKEGLKYVLVQVVGGAAGAAATILIYLFDASNLSGGWPIAALRGTNPKYTLTQACVAEFYGTFLLCYVVLAVASTKKPLKQYTAFCIGGSIIAGGYAFGPLSGGVLNPAIALANGIGCKMHILTSLDPFAYVGSELFGGVVAALVFKFVTHEDEYKEAGLLSGEAN